MQESTITSKGQTTIPVELRALLGVKPGDKISYTPKPNGDIVIRRKKTYTLEDLFGILPKPKETLTVKQMNQAIIDAVVAKYDAKERRSRRKTAKPK